MEKIEIHTLASESGDAAGCRLFDVVDHLPAIGEKDGTGTVRSAIAIHKDPLKATEGTAEWDCYRIDYEENETAPRFVAISRIARNHMERVIRINGLPPTVQEANIIIGSMLRHHPQLAAEMQNVGDDLIQTYFGISNQLYEEMVVVGSGVCTEFSDKSLRALKEPNNDLPALCKEASVTADAFGVTFLAKVPYWWDCSVDLLDISRDVLDDLADRGFFPKRTVNDLHPDVFHMLLISCEEGEDWLAWEGGPLWFDLISLNASEVLSIANLITTVYLGRFSEILKMAGLSQTAFAERFFISLRTVQDWCSGKSACKGYLRLLFAEQLGLFKRRIS